MVIRRAEDVTAAKRENRLGVLLGSEGGAFLKGSVELLRVFHHLGLRFVQLTWAYTNDLAAAQAETDLGKGLTPAGRKMVSEMCRLGIIIDLSHLSRRSIEDCFELSDKPMVFSHGHAFREAIAPDWTPEQMKKLILNRESSECTSVPILWIPGLPVHMKRRRSRICSAKSTGA